MAGDRQYIYPFETMLCAYPPAYLAPEQSRYHNLGMNGYITPGRLYPDKRPGFLGDYGPKQEGDALTLAHGVYPLDSSILNSDRANNYRAMRYGVLNDRIFQQMSPKSATVLRNGLNTCNSNVCGPYNPNCPPYRQ